MGAGDDSSSKPEFDRLIVESIPAMLRFATRLTGDVNDAEDVVQDALLRAARSWRAFRGESRITTWLFRIVVNVFRDRYRSRDDLGSIEHELPARNDPTQPIEANELGQIVAWHVSNLPPRQREVLVLIAYEQLNTAETARVLEMSEQSVRTNLHFARERMREKLAKYMRERVK
jgi:RNA polymerase sigma-70 factor, ECF subfamily